MSKAVPAVPSLHTIQDPATRNALQAIVDGWNVRNGATGNGDNRFITASELGDSKTIRMIASAALQQLDDKQREDIPNLIADISAKITESALWKYMTQRIEDIYRPNTGWLDKLFLEAKEIKDNATLVQTALSKFGDAMAGVAIQWSVTSMPEMALAKAFSGVVARFQKNEALINSEITARVNADNAIVQSVNTQMANVNGSIAGIQSAQTTLSNNFAALSTQTNTIQARINNIGGATLEQKFQATADANGALQSQYTIKAQVDANGRLGIAGIGLAATANNGATFTEAYIIADRFAVGDANSRVIPFIVQDGKVLINQAMINRLDAVNIYGSHIDGGIIRGATMIGKDPYLVASKADPIFSNPNSPYIYTKLCNLMLEDVNAGNYSDYGDDKDCYFTGPPLRIYSYSANNGSYTRFRNGQVSVKVVVSVRTDKPQDYSNGFMMSWLRLQSPAGVFFDSGVIGHSQIINPGVYAYGNYTLTIRDDSPSEIITGTETVRKTGTGPFVYEFDIRDVWFWGDWFMQPQFMWHLDNGGPTNGGIYVGMKIEARANNLV